MDLAAVILFLVLYYLRPQEWPLGLQDISFVKNVMLFGLASLFFRARGLQLRDLFRTPHDWAVLAFWLWIVFASQAPWETFKESANLYVFYIVIVQALYTVPRMEKFVGWWTFLIASIAILALLSQVGFDPLGSHDLTMGRMQGRLSLGLSIFDNPNALGHSLVPAIPLLYYFCIWKRSVFLRVIGVLLMGAVAECIFATVSKGAFISGAVTIVATLTFGRPKAVQAIIITAAVMFGGSALYALPRMQELNKAKTDEAIQGRILAFKHGYRMFSTHDKGVGFKNWQKSFLAQRYRFAPSHPDEKSRKKSLQQVVYKAPHSSYVGLGAELGKPGFYLFFGILYCCLRTLVTAKTSTPEEERIRRILFVLIVSYMVSSWMVDFAYRPTFFMFAAATAALHRQLHGLNEIRQREDEEKEREAAEPFVPTWRARLKPQPKMEGALAQMGVPAAVMTLEKDGGTQDTEAEIAAAETAKSRIGFAWNRLGWIDFALTFAMTYAAIRYWLYLIQKM
jgi:hypothetical protein